MFLAAEKVIRLDSDRKDDRRHYVVPSDLMLAWAVEQIPQLAMHWVPA